MTTTNIVNEEKQIDKNEIISAWYKTYTKLSTAKVSPLEFFQHRLEETPVWEIRHDIEYMNARLEQVKI